MIQAKRCKTNTILLSLIAVLILLPINAFGEKNHLQFTAETLSADLKDIPVKVVLDELKKEKGIWCEGEIQLLKKNISLKFDDLTLTEGIKRMLKSYNYALIYNKSGELNGVVIIDGSSSENAAAVPVDPPLSPTPQKNEMITPPLGDNITPPMGDNITPPMPKGSVPVVSKDDIILPPKGNQLPPGVSKEVLDKLKMNNQMPPMPEGLPE